MQALINEPNLLAGLKRLDGTPNYTNGGGVYNFAKTLPKFNAINSYAVRKKTISAHAQASFGGERWSANAGVRIVHTDTVASTAVNDSLSVTVADTANPTNAGVAEYAAITPITAKGSDTVPLPSANFLYHLTGRLQLRLAGAEVIARPNLNQLAPTAANNAINQQYQLIYAGRANLQPIKAWQEDVSLEWYDQPSALVSVPVAGVSPTTFSINPFYEKGPVSISASWDYTSPFWYETFTEVTGEPAKAKHYDWVTATAAYNFTKRLRFYVEGKNLANSIVRTYLNGNPYAVWANGTTGTSSAVGQGFTAYGRTITFGMRYGF